MGLTRTIDSVIVRETVVIRDRPDTVTVWHDRTQWRTRIVHDTVRIRTTDTVVRMVEKERIGSSLPPSQMGERTPGWAWTLAATLAGLIIAQIIRVKNRLNNR